jgi:thiol-disulfide isomerase/thioredoxin
MSENFFSKSKYIEELSSTSFQKVNTFMIKPELLKKCKTVAVLFYAPWCGHCERAKPMWELLGEYLNDNKVKLAAFNCVENEAHLMKMNIDKRGFVSSYPTIILYNGKIMKKFDGDFKELKEYIEKLKLKSCPRIK